MWLWSLWFDCGLCGAIVGFGKNTEASRFFAKFAPNSSGFRINLRRKKGRLTPDFFSRNPSACTAIREMEARSDGPLFLLFKIIAKDEEDGSFP